jgi:hypothetical protein
MARWIEVVGLGVVVAALAVGCGGSSAGGKGGHGTHEDRPQIARFTASPAIISAGEASTLSWEVSGATALSIAPGVGTVTGTSTAVHPTATTTYTLTATSSAGAVTATVTVTIAAGDSYSLPVDRVTSWSLAGMLSKGGIPSASWPACNATPLAPRGGGQDDGPAIQALVDRCAAGTVAKLAAGAFTLGTGGVVLLDKGIVLRGAGAGVTILDKPMNRFPTGTVSVDDGVQQRTEDASPIVVVGPQRWAGPDGDGRCNGLTAYDTHFMQRLSADGAKGQRSVTVASGAIFRAGQLVLLDETSGAGWQPDRAGIAASVWASPDYAVEWNQHPSDVGSGDGQWQPLTPSPANNWAAWGNGSNRPCWSSRHDRPQNEIKEIEQVDGDTVTFTSPLHKDYRVARYAELTTFTGENEHVRNAGVEALSLTGGGDEALVFVDAAYSWARNIEVARSIGGVAFVDAFRVELRDSYIHDGAWPSPGGAGYNIDLSHASSELLIENNISVNADKVMVARSSGSGSVVAYNYMNGGYIFYNTAWIETGLNASHMAGSHHVLFEGNQAFNLDSDDTHGNSTYMTYFRNYATSVRDPFRGVVDIGTVDDATSADAAPKRAVGPMRYAYWFSFVGNVLGKPGLTTAAHGYVDESAGLGANGAAIWLMGWNDVGPYTSDPHVAETAIRDGNWDWFLGRQTWLTASEGTPHLLPSSLYLTAAPRFFGANPWPWVDPTTGAVYTLPAKARLDAGTPNVVP